MNGTAKSILIIGGLLIGSFVNAKETPLDSLGVGALLSSSQNEADDVNNALGGNIYGAYSLYDWVGIEGGVGYYGGIIDGSEHLIGVDGYVTGTYLLASDVIIKVGGGGFYGDTSLSPAALLGVSYILTPDWLLDFTYKVFTDIGENDDNLYSMRAGVTYRFPSPTKKSFLISPKKMTSLVVTSQQKVTCKDITQHVDYIVRKGDTLSRIAKINSISLEDIIILNPTFKGRDFNLIYPYEKIIISMTSTQCLQ